MGYAVKDPQYFFNSFPLERWGMCRKIILGINWLWTSGRSCAQRSSTPSMSLTSTTLWKEKTRDENTASRLKHFIHLSSASVTNQGLYLVRKRHWVHQTWDRGGQGIEGIQVEGNDIQVDSWKYMKIIMLFKYISLRRWNQSIPQGRFIKGVTWKFRQQFQEQEHHPWWTGGHQQWWWWWWWWWWWTGGNQLTTNSRQDACQGDSGGPLWTEVAGRAVLIGSLFITWS